MAIEIIQTGDEYVPTNQEQIVEPTLEPIVEPEVPAIEPEVIPEVEPEVKPDADPESKEETKEETKEEGETPEYFFGEQSVEVTIPDDVRAELEGKGLDIDAIVGEMYAKDGNGKPSEESYGKLCEAFGKFSVDAYFNSLAIQNQNTLDGVAKQQADYDAANEARYSEVLELIGGEENWEKISEYAVANLSEEEFEQLNQVMESGNTFAQNLALLDMQNRLDKHNAEPQGLKLIEGNGGEADVDMTPLSRTDYIKETSQLASKFPHDKVAYREAQAKLDTRRKMAM